MNQERSVITRHLESVDVWGGTGRGMGGGAGRRMNMDSGSISVQKMANPTPSWFPGKTALSDLKKQAVNLRQQMEAIQSKIKNMEKQQ